MRTVSIGLMCLWLLASGTPAVGQTADPLGLISHGALVPYIGSGEGGGPLAVLMLSSPVGSNAPPEEPDGTRPLHMFFFDQTCTRSGPSVGSPLTTNDTDLLSLNNIGIPDRGLVAIGSIGDAGPGDRLEPLSNPIHARVLWINAGKDFIRVLEPIAIQNAEALDTTQTWNPLRSAVAFYAGLEGPTSFSTLVLVCPTKAVTTGIFPPPAFPMLRPKPPVSGPTPLFLRIYDDEERFLRDLAVTCECLTMHPLTSIDPVYSDPVSAPRGTYTEIEGRGAEAGDPARAFTGYLATKLDGRDMFGRLHNGSRSSLRGTLTPGER